MKLLGAAVILAGCLLAGVSAARELERAVLGREAEVSRLIRLRSLVMGARVPLEEALALCGIALSEAQAPFSERWAEWAAPGALRELGAFLPGTDETAKAAAFARALTEAEEALTAAREKRARDRKLALSLSALGGMAAVIALL